MFCPTLLTLTYFLLSGPMFLRVAGRAVVMCLWVLRERENGENCQFSFFVLSLFPCFAQKALH